MLRNRSTIYVTLDTPFESQVTDQYQGIFLGENHEVFIFFENHEAAQRFQDTVRLLQAEMHELGTA